MLAFQIYRAKIRQPLPQCKPLGFAPSNEFVDRNHWSVWLEPVFRGVVNEISEFATNIPMTVNAAVIHKGSHKAKYTGLANPHELPLKFCVERAVRFFQDLGQADVFAHHATNTASHCCNKFLRATSLSDR